jgi:predicted DNA-binding transcriptional regulator YafY
MNYIDRIERLYHIHQLIQAEETGTPEEFARQFHISRSHIYNILDELRDCGAEIKFSRIKNTFYYCNDFDVPVRTLHLSFYQKN